MARIRTIKPEFFLHEELYDLEVETGLPIRVAFAGLWCQADREGRFKWKPRTLKAGVLPFDDIDFSRVLDALTTRGFVRKYTVSHVEYGWIPSFRAHQIVNGKERKSEIPPPPKEYVINHLYLGTNVPKSVFDAIVKRDGFQCLKCQSKDDLTLDHVIPQALAFDNSELNLRTLCRKCNSKRPTNGEELDKEIHAWFTRGHALDHLESVLGHAWPRVVADGSGERKGKERNKEGKGKEGDICPESENPTSGQEPSSHQFEVDGGEGTWTLPQIKLDEYIAAFPNLDVGRQMELAAGWIRNNPTKRKTARGMPRFLFSWLSRAQETPRRGGVKSSLMDDPQIQAWLNQ